MEKERERRLLRAERGRKRNAEGQRDERGDSVGRERKREMYDLTRVVSAGQGEARGARVHVYTRACAHTETDRGTDAGEKHTRESEAGSSGERERARDTGYATGTKLRSP